MVALALALELVQGAGRVGQVRVADERRAGVVRRREVRGRGKKG